jgi:large subunit ribosomal protein L31
MKKDIHPKLNPVIFLDASTGKEFITTSFLKSEEIKKIDGVDHFVIRVEVTSDSHPFYTGKHRVMDTTGRVEKFKQKMEKAAANKKTKKEEAEEQTEEAAA